VTLIGTDHAPIAVLVGGIKLSEEDLDSVIEDGADVVITPDLQGLDPVSQFVLLLAVNLTISGVTYAINRMALDDRVPDLNDTSSPAYLVGGISTRREAGFPIPVVYGEHRCGGQFIGSASSETKPTPYGQASEEGAQDWIHVLVAYSEGPIHRIGDIDAGICGEINDLGFNIVLPFGPQVPTRPLPVGLRINGTNIEIDPQYSRVLAHLRMGTRHQSPVRGPLRAASAIQSFDEQLLQGNPVVYETIDEVDAVDIKLQFPSGLYDTNGTALQPYTVDFEIKFQAHRRQRLHGTQIVATLALVSQVRDSRRGRLSVRRSDGTAYESATAIEVRVERVTADDNQTSGIIAELAFALEVRDGDHRERLCLAAFIALMGRQLGRRASECRGRSSSVTVPVKGRTLSRYDGTLEEWIDEEWDDGSINITAKNPAWVIADLLTNTRYGAGRLSLEIAAGR
jgi:hypothetical protein